VPQTSVKQLSFVALATNLLNVYNIFLKKKKKYCYKAVEGLFFCAKKGTLFATSCPNLEKMTTH